MLIDGLIDPIEVIHTVSKHAVPWLVTSVLYYSYGYSIVVIIDMLRRVTRTVIPNHPPIEKRGSTRMNKPGE